MVKYGRLGELVRESQYHWSGATLRLSPGGNAMYANQSMTLWNTRWALLAGVVVCGECLRGQSLSESSQPFEHEPGCGNAIDAGAEPWIDLHNILDLARG
jgi:hypothetical protein